MALPMSWRVVLLRQFQFAFPSSWPKQTVQLRCNFASTCRFLSSSGSESSTKIARSRSPANALVFVAQEADRLASLATSKTRANDATEEVAGRTAQALDAASTLLIVSRPSEALLNATVDKGSAALLASLHRAFLTITSWCLDCFPSDQNAVILDRVLQLARRAHALSLPFHLPLYQRLMEAQAKYDEDVNADSLLEVFSWAKGLLDAPLEDMRLFAPALRALIQRESFRPMVELLVEIKGRDMQIDFLLAADLLMLLRDYTRRAILTHVKSIPESEISFIVSLLEPSVLQFLEQQKRASSEGSLRDQLKSVMDQLDPSQIQELLSSFLRQDNDLSREDFEDEEADGDHDPIDDAIDSILLRGMSSAEARQLIVELINISKKGSEKNSPARTRVMGFLVSRTGVKVQDIVSEALASEDDSENSGWSDRETGREDALYLRGSDHELYPDVVSQIVRLNRGRALQLTKAYEEFLWARDFADDEVFFDSLGVSTDSETDGDRDD